MNIVLKSKEGHKFEIPQSVAFHSLLVKEMFEPNESNHPNEIHLQSITTNILKIIIEFMNYFHANGMSVIDTPIQYMTIKQIVGEWYSDFINKYNDNIVDILHASNYLMIDSLIQLSCASIAILLKDKSIEEVREILEIQEDIEEEATLVEKIYSNRCRH